MRLSVAIAVSCLVLTGLATADPAAAAAKKPISIPAQGLAPALQALAASREFQVLYRTEVVGDLQTAGAVGEFTLSEALTQLLKETGLTYQYLDDKTITIIPAGPVVPAKAGTQSNDRAQRSTPNTFRLAQAEPLPGTSGGGTGREQNGEEYQPHVTALPEVLVKGSRSLNMDIERTADGAQPYIVFDRSVIEQSGAVNVEEFLRTRLTAASSVLSSAQTQGSGNTNSIIDLRGLGANQTLILIDGRRASPLNNFGGTGQPDLNAIPLSAIERIEILPATASGIYGGGATGGVVNIILRRDYSGLETTLTYGDSFDGGGGTRRVDLAGGFQLEGGRTSVTFNGSYSDGTDLYWGDRNLMQAARNRAATNTPESIYALGAPPVLGATTNITSIDGSNLSLKPQYGGVSVGSAFTYVPSGYQGAASDSGAALRANAGRYNLDLANTAQQQGGGKQSLLSSARVKSLSASLRRSFTSSLDGFVELSGSQNEGAARSSFVSSTFFVPAGSPVNPFDQDVFVTTPASGTDQTASNVFRNTRAVGGLIFDLSRNWRGEVDYTWSRSRTRTFYPDAVIGLEGSDAVMNGTTASGANFNVFQAASALDYSSFLTIATTRSPLVLTMHDAALRLGGPLSWSLPAGTPTVSFLLEYRQEALDDVITTTPDAVLTAYSRGQNVRSAYLETVVPLLAARDPAQETSMLDLQVAVRRDEYRTTGSNLAIDVPGFVVPDPPTSVTRKWASVDPTVSLRFQPLRDITFRTTYSTGFLAPAMSQLVPDLPQSFPVPFYTDPRRGNEVLGTVTLTGGGNASLRPEESKSWSAGFILKPRMLTGLRFSADYVRIKKTDNIINFGFTQDNINNERLLPGIITRGPPSDGFDVGPITGFNSQNVNLANQKVESVDLSLDYHTTLGQLGNFSVALAGTRNLHNVSRTSAAAPEFENLRLINVLPWQGNLQLAWDRAAWTVQWSSRFIDSYCLLTDCATGPVTLSQGSTTVPSQLYHDVSVRYRFSAAANTLLDNTEIRVGATNVFNKKPPVDLGNFSFYSTYGDPRLASYSISLRKAF